MNPIHSPNKGDSPILGFHGDFRFLSNFHYVRVTLDGVTYPTVEHAYQAAKTLDTAMRESIRLARTPGVAKRLGRAVVLRPGWDEMKLQVMHDLQVEKYSHPELADLLMWTGDRYLEETNVWKDRFWGVYEGRGKNNLGIILMRIREWLK